MKDLGLKLLAIYMIANGALFATMLHDGLTDANPILGRLYHWNGTQVFFLGFLIVICLMAAGICLFAIYENNKFYKDEQ